jgi:hypothetical protein
VFPEHCGYELEERDDVDRADLGARRFAPEEEVEEFEAYGVALDVKAVINTISIKSIMLLMVVLK